MSNIAKLALMINLFVFTINFANADLITLEINHVDSDAVGAKIHVSPPQSDKYTIDIGVETTQIELELNDIGRYEFTAQSYDISGNSSEESDPVFYEVKQEVEPGNDDEADADNGIDFKDASNRSRPCFLSSVILGD